MGTKIIAVLKLFMNKYLTCSSNEGSPPDDLDACPVEAGPPAPPLLPPLLSLLSARHIGVRRRYVFPFALLANLEFAANKLCDSTSQHREEYGSHSS